MQGKHPSMREETAKRIRGSKPSTHIGTEIVFSPLPKVKNFVILGHGEGSNFCSGNIKVSNIRCPGPA